MSDKVRLASNFACRLRNQNKYECRNIFFALFLPLDNYSVVPIPQSHNSF